MQPMMASGAVTMMAGVRNGRLRSGSVRRSTSTAIDTAAKANRVPELDTSARMPTGKNAANSATNPPVRMVMTCGVWNLGGSSRGVGQQAVGSSRRPNPGRHHHQDDRGERRRRREPIRLPTCGQPFCTWSGQGFQHEQTTAASLMAAHCWRVRGCRSGRKNAARAGAKRAATRAMTPAAASSRRWCGYRANRSIKSACCPPVLWFPRRAVETASSRKPT